MALAIVTGTTTEGHSNAASFNLTLRQTPTIGNILVVWVEQFAGTPSGITCSDNQASGGNTYSPITFASFAGGPGGRFFYAKITKATGTFTLSLGSLNSQGNAAMVYEVSGQDATTPYTSEQNSNTGSATAGAIAASAAVTNTTNPNSIIFNALSSGGNGAITQPATWSIDSTNAEETDGSNYEVGGLAYKIVSSTASQSGSWTTFANTAYVTVVVVFQQASTTNNHFLTLMGAGT